MVKPEPLHNQIYTVPQDQPGQAQLLESCIDFMQSDKMAEQQQQPSNAPPPSASSSSSSNNNA